MNRREVLTLLGAAPARALGLAVPQRFSRVLMKSLNKVVGE